MAEEFKYADSMGIDFHKTGFCPYLSSLFLCRRRKDYYAMNPSKFQAMEDLKYGNYNPYQTTLELTRSSTGALSALVSLKTLGVMGFQQMYAEMFEASEYFRQELAKDARICIINSESCWLASLFILKPKEYADLTLQDILKLNHSEIEAIKQYNVNFAKYIQRDAYNAKIDFVFTSSRSHLVPGTNIALGTLKAYPMSVFFDKKAAANIVRELRNEIDRIKVDIYKKLDMETRKAVFDRFHQLLTESNVNVTSNGVVRYYLTKNASLDVLDDYLTQLINSMYDVVGYCF